MVTFPEALAHVAAHTLLLALAAAALTGAFLILRRHVHRLRSIRAFHASARAAAGVDNPLRHTDVSNLDGELRRLLEQEAGQ